MSSQTAVALKGRNRPTRQAAAQHRYADMKVETNGYVFEEQPYVNGDADPTARVDLTKLKVQALRKYTKVYELQGIHPQSSKEELTSAVSRHWNQSNVTEEGVLQNLRRLQAR
ncbi:hypothetical protein Ndes2526B_g00213 [Nannochloris sp. 'desiccata']|nr:hypothetical protein KSW81_003024 [Chlorella desiccata (nom. nud.)]KAH7624846.1 hypothetical protein NADE_002068 [Chlorella desiccata (nom. nud.)]